MNNYNLLIMNWRLLAWGYAYACQVRFPGSIIGYTDASQPRTFLELLFLSFTNLFAAGLGGILPISAPARMLVMLKQFSGIAYVAVVVFRLIGLTLVRHETKN